MSSLLPKDAVLGVEVSPQSWSITQGPLRGRLGVMSGRWGIPRLEPGLPRRVRDGGVDINTYKRRRGIIARIARLRACRGQIRTVADSFTSRGSR